MKQTKKNKKKIRKIKSLKKNQCIKKGGGNLKNIINYLLFIVTPSLGRNTLKRTCDSIYNQTYKNWKHIIMFDNINDEQINNLLSEIKYSPIIKKGIWQNFGNGQRYDSWDLENDPNSIFLYIDDDDYYSNVNSFTKIVNKFNNSKLDVVFFPGLRYDKYFFNRPPREGKTMSNQFAHKKYDKNGNPIRWIKKNKGDKSAGIDGKFINNLVKQYDYDYIFGEHLVTVPKSNNGILVHDTINYKPRIGIYTYNFGNFRNELNKGIDNFVSYPEFDYYLYTDQNIKSSKWKVINVPLQSRKNYMNANRVTAKYYKWKIIPNELKKYDYILHIDSRIVWWINRLSPNKIYNIINSNPNTLIFLRRHSMFNSIHDEARQCIKTNVDNVTNVNRWLEFYKKNTIVNNVPHCETGLHLKKNNTKINNTLSEVYNTLVNNKICRDQLVFTYVLNKNLKKEDFKFIKEFTNPYISNKIN